MANYGIEKLEKTAKTAKALTVGCVSLLVGGVALIVKQNGEDDQKELDNKVEQPKTRKK